MKWGGQFLFTGSTVTAIHQPHPRIDFTDAAADAVASARAMAEACASDPTYRVANAGRVWGSEDLIVARDWWDD
jgi:hypothetical protein